MLRKKITATSFVSRPCAYNRTIPPGQCHTSTWMISDNCFFKEENQIVHFHLISVPIAKGKIDITLTTTKLKVPKEIELPGGRREGLDCIKARSRSQTIPIVSAPHVLKIQILAQNVFAMRVVFLHSSQSILGPGESKPSYEGEKMPWVPLLLSSSIPTTIIIIFTVLNFNHHFRAYDLWQSDMKNNGFSHHGLLRVFALFYIAWKSTKRKVGKKSGFLHF